MKEHPDIYAFSVSSIRISLAIHSIPLLKLPFQTGQATGSDDDLEDIAVEKRQFAVGATQLNSTQEAKALEQGVIKDYW